MAKNFRMHTKETGNQCLALYLSGDFDGSSACELVQVLDEHVNTKTKVAIDTSGLREIARFGRVVFLARMSWLQDKRADIEVTGRFREIFLEA